MEMEWGKEQVFHLISMYRDRPVLWNSSEPRYTNRAARISALMEIAQAFGEDNMNVIERKIRNLVGNFTNECNKERYGFQGNPYVCKWYCYDHMLFLNDRPKPKKDAQINLEWTNEAIFELIQCYKSEPVLWNTKCAGYKNREEQCNAWNRVKSKLRNGIVGNISVKAIKWKKDILLSSYRKLRNQIVNSMKTANGPDDVYKTDWIFYKAMSEFLDKVFHPRRAKNGDVYNSGTEESSTDPNSMDYLSGISMVETAQPTRKRYKIRSHDESAKESEMIQEDLRINSEDKFSLWIRVWESKLRELPAEQVRHAEKLINDVLYEASLGSLNRKCSLSVIDGIS